VANKLTIEVKGLGGLLNRVKLLVPQIRQSAGDTVAETLLLIETDAKLLSPVDTGLNRAEIHSELAPNRLYGVVAAGTEYAVHLEFGTRYMRARPFLFPAYEKNRAQFLARLKANLKLF
jgi:HK97 gp10 family phage protein